jgi:hypothetical protein
MTQVAFEPMTTMLERVKIVVTLAFVTTAIAYRNTGDP